MKSNLEQINQIGCFCEGKRFLIIELNEMMVIIYDIQMF